MDTRNEKGEPVRDQMNIDSHVQVSIPLSQFESSYPEVFTTELSRFFSVSDKAHLATTCRHFNTLFKSELKQLKQYAIDKLLTHVIRGEQAEAEEMIRSNPLLLLESGIVEDYSGRKIKGTALRLALGAEDVKYHDDEECMVEMIQKYLKRLPNGEAIIAEQTKKQFPEGWIQKEAERQIRDHAALIQVINVIDNPPGANDTERNSATENAIQVFSRYLALENNCEGRLFETGKHFNHQLLAEALDLYNQNYIRFGGFDSAQNGAVWRKVIGTIERYVPAATAQAFCTCLTTIVSNRGKLKRTLSLLNTQSRQATSYFPLDVDSSSLLGRDFAVESFPDQSYPAVGIDAESYNITRDFLDAFTKLMSNKNIKLAALMQHPQPQPESTATGCVIC